MTDRVEALRTHLAGRSPWICPERARLFTRSWKETEGQPMLIRRALAFKEVLENQTVFITPGELIVGNQASGVLATPIFPEYGGQWLEKEMDGLATRRLDRYGITPEARAELKEISAWWRGRTHFDRVKAESYLAIPDAWHSAWDPDNGSFAGVVSNSGRMATGNGHVIADFDRMLRIGLRGVLEEAQAEYERWGASYTEEEALKRRIFLKSVIISMEAGIRFARRYSEEAARLAAETEDPAQHEELLQVAAILRRVPEHPARTLWEALQSFWLVHLMLQIEANGHSMSLGRFDQYLQPYYQRDLALGITTRERALELVECFLIKCNEIRKIRQWSHTRKMHGYPLFQTLTIGGVTRDGADAANDFSFIVLDATAAVKMQEPTTIARIHPKSSQEFLLACVKTVVSHGGGLPGFFNDEVAVQMLMNTGVSLEDARDWAVDGCCEPIVPGKHNTITSGTCHFNLLKVLDLALNNGTDARTGLTLCPGNGALEQLGGYEQLVQAYRKQLDFYVTLAPVLDTVTSRAHRELTPCPFLSGLLDYRIQIGRDVEEGGGPNYNSTLMIGHASVNVGNALYAMKKAVYEEKRVSPAELRRALAANFQGEENARVRRILLDCPKYGNDIDEVDFTVRDSLNWFLKSFSRFTPVRGGYFCPSPQTISSNAYTGESIGASPDGRLAGQPTADNSSPAAGDDLHGATATLRSVAKLDHAYATHGTILNMRFHPTAVSGEARLGKFAALIRTFFDLQGFQVQFNIVSAETLKAAQKQPDKYRSLVVKVAGYSALFTSLDEQLQNQIIARTEHVSA
jgi:pyruvate formate-lyase/glycerol dehydratase family glycyl radical enzyme